MRKSLWLGVIAWMLASAPASAQPLTLFLRSAPLGGLAQSPDVLNLSAQPVNKVPQNTVNAFNDFYLINGPGKLKVHFNEFLQNLGQKALPGWIGVARYSNHAIFYDLDIGWEEVKAHYKMPSARVARVTVYKTLNTGQLVYDYAVPMNGGVCREYLFTPETQGFQLGMVVNCFETLGVSRGRLGRPGRT